MSNSLDLGVYIENMINIGPNEMEVFAWDEPGTPTVGHVRLINVWTHTSEPHRIHVTTSDNKHYIVQVFTDDTPLKHT